MRSIFISLGLLIGSVGFLVSTVMAQATSSAPDLTEPVSDSYYTYEINEEDESVEVVSHCSAEKTPPNFEEPSDCIAFCDTCVLRDDLCWYCDQEEAVSEYKEPGLWNGIKNWFNRIFRPNAPAAGGVQPAGQQKGWFGKLVDAIVNVFTKEDPEQVAQEIGEDKLKEAGKKVLEHHEAKKDGTEGPTAEEVENALKEAFANANNIADLTKLRSMMMWYCSNEYGISDAEHECRARMMAEFKKRGDVLKHKLLDAIDPSDGSADTFQKMRNLYAILMAGENASGEGVWFSTDNIKQVRAQLRAKAKEWMQNALNKAGLAEMANWRIFADAYTNISGGGSDLFEGFAPKGYVQYRAQRLALQAMAAMDICNPDPEKLKQLQDLLNNNGRSCLDLLGSQSVCDLINAGKIEEAYKKLYEFTKDDEASSKDPNQAPEPIDCTKPTTQTTDTTVDDDTEDTDEGNDTDEAAAVDDGGAIDPTQGGQYTDDSDESSELNNEPDEENEQTEEQAPASESELPEEPETPVSGGDEDGSTGEYDEDQEDQEEEEDEEPPQDEPKPEPDYTCSVSTHYDDTTGWDYSVIDCEYGYYDSFECWMMCGSMPPMVVAEETEFETLCYETAGGFVDYNMIMPCRHDPEPAPDITQCASDCLRDNWLPY